MEPLLCFPDPPPAQLAKALDAAGYPWTAAADTDAAKRADILAYLQTVSDAPVPFPK